MNVSKRFRSIPAVAILLLMAGAVFAQDGAPSKSAAEVVTPHVYVSLDRVPRSKPFQIALVIDIAENYHMNSHKPLDSFLIPTILTPTLPPGFKLVDTIYPPGHQKKFPFSPDKPLDVYSGSATLRLKLIADSTAALGSTTIPMTLRYQACNMNACLPPVKISATAQFEMIKAGASSHPAHADIFAAKE